MTGGIILTGRGWKRQVGPHTWIGYVYPLQLTWPEYR